jgi:hypothetical protein
LTTWWVLHTRTQRRSTTGRHALGRPAAATVSSCRRGRCRARPPGSRAHGAARRPQAIFVESNQGDCGTTKIFKIVVYGSAGETFNVAEIKKVGEDS